MLIFYFLSLSCQSVISIYSIVLLVHDIEDILARVVPLSSSLVHRDHRSEHDRTGSWLRSSPCQCRSHIGDRCQPLVALLLLHPVQVHLPPHNLGCPLQVPCHFLWLRGGVWNTFYWLSQRCALHSEKVHNCATVAQLKLCSSQVIHVHNIFDLCGMWNP